MPTYSYKSNAPAVADVIEGILFSSGVLVNYGTDQLNLNKYVPTRLDRYVDGVLSNTDLVTPASVTNQERYESQSEVGLSAAEVFTVKNLTAGIGIGTIMLVAKTNQVFTRNSANAGGDATAVTIYSFVVPGGSMGPNGTLNYEAELTYTNSATSKQFTLYVGGTPINPGPTLAVSTAAANWSGQFHNSATGVNKFRGSMVKNQSSTVGFTATTIDTSIDFTVDIRVNWSVSSIAAESISLQSFRAWVEYGA
jgi:hypothetical protein